MQRCPGMAPIAEALAEVAVRCAFAAGGRGERPARQALVAEVDSRSYPRHAPDLAAVTARRRASHRGGSDFGLPNLGGTLAEVPSPSQFAHD